MHNKDIAQQLRVGRVQVARWRERYGQLRLAGIEHDLARAAPPVKVDVGRLVEMSRASGIAVSAIRPGMSPVRRRRTNISRAATASTGMP